MEKPGELQQKKDTLVLANQVQDEKVRKELAQETARLQRLRLELDLAKAEAEKELLARRQALDRARMELDEMNNRNALAYAKAQQESGKELAKLRAAKERMDLEADLANAEFQKKNNVFRAKELEWNSRLEELRGKLAVREKELEVDAYAEQHPVYLEDPLQPDGSLVLSDRRIPLNGPITMESADEICARIDFFNNKDHKYPIFIVIDNSPGGSVMAGYKILKSMQSSSAPVYVVVKSFAASMAAAITTLAQRSFAYPNAIILHHQISAGTMGNLTVQRESVKSLEQWWQRLAAPIATKMGITLEQFTKEMYAHTATGDWKEFADEAVKLHWVDTVVNRCQETAWIKNPDRDRSGSGQYASAGSGGDNSAKSGREAATQGSSKSGAVLPRLNPVDCYYLYNPDGYYRVE